MADVHDSAVTQQQLYEQRVMFFLAPDEFFPEAPDQQSSAASKIESQGSEKRKSRYSAMIDSISSEKIAAAKMNAAKSDTTEESSKSRDQKTGATLSETSSHGDVATISRSRNESQSSLEPGTVVTLYQPRPTLKELAEASSRGPKRISMSEKSDTASANSPSDAVSNHSSSDVSDAVKKKSPESVMAEFAEHEHRFREEFQFAAETMLLLSGGDGGGGNKSHKVNRAVSHYGQKNAGFRHLENLLQLMQQLTVLQHDNMALKRKCSFLEDTKAIVSLQYKAQQVANNKMMHKSGNLFSKAGNKVMHYLSSPSTSVTSAPFQPASPQLTHAPSQIGNTPAQLPRPHHVYHRVNSDVSAYTTDVIEDKPRPIRIQRSSSFGSIDDLDLRVRRELSRPQSTTSHHEKSVYHLKTSKSTPRKKQNKRFAPKWSKMKRVFSKPETGSKTETYAVSAEEIVRMNKKSGMDRARPPGLSNSKSLDHGELASPWIVSDKLLGVDPPKTSPSSPSSIQSEPGTAFPATTPHIENEYAEIGPPSTVAAYVSVDTKLTHRHSMAFSTARRSLALEERFSMSDQENGERRLNDSPPPLVRRKSSPNLSMSSLSDSRNYLETPNGDRLRRANSAKSAKSERKHRKDRSITNRQYIEEHLLSPADAQRAKLLASACADQEETHTRAKAAWFKVKDMIHTRRDSLKKQRRRTYSRDEDVSPEGSSWENTGARSDLDYEYDITDHHYCSISREESPSRGLTRSNTLTTKTASPHIRRKRARSMKLVPGGTDKNAPAAGTGCVNEPARVKKESTVVLPTGAVDVSALMGGMSDEFSRKMQEWEDKKRGGIPTKDSSEDSATKFSEDFIRRMEEWERMKGIESTSPPRPKESVAASPPPRSPPIETVHLTTAEQKAEHLSASFSKTVQEWERIKEKRVKKTPEPAACKSSRSRQSERSKSGDRLPREKSRQRYEREIQKREQKLEKERQKLEKMKLRLENYDGRAESLPLDFFKKLQEWDLLRTLKPDQSRELMGEHHPVHARSRSEKHHRESISVPRERILSDSSIGPPPPHLQRKSVVIPPMSGMGLSGEESGGGGGGGYASPPQQLRGVCVEDDSTSIDLSLTMETIALLEDTNNKLSSELQEREDDMLCLQDDMQQLTERMNAMNRDYTQQIAEYKRELWASSKIGVHTLETDAFSTSIKELKQKLNQLQEFGERVLLEKRESEGETLDALRIRVEREEALLTQIEKLQQSLDSRAYVRGTEVFDRLYQYLHNVQSQVWSLKEGIQERNSVIEHLQRHLLVQNVTTRLLTSQLRQRDAALSYVKQQRRAGVLRRWQTFHGHDVIVRQDGTVSLRKKQDIADDKQIAELSNVIVRAKSLLHDNRQDAMALHFDWLDGMQAQIQEVQESQQFDAGNQTEVDTNETESQTLMSLVSQTLPLSRLQWDGTLLPVHDKCLQSAPSTADAAVYIEDVEVYDLKQRGKWRRRKKIKDESPHRGAVFRKMEIFETSRSRELKAQRKLLANNGKDQSSLEDSDTKTVIGKKILDYEHSENESPKCSADDSVFESEDKFLLANKNRASINQRDNSTSPEESGIDSRFVFPNQSKLNSNLNASFTITLPSEDTKENINMKVADANYVRCVKAKKKDKSSLQFIDATVSTPQAGDIHLHSRKQRLDSSRSEPSSPFYKDTVGNDGRGHANTLDAKPPKLPLSPVVRSKYSRKLKPDAGSGPLRSSPKIRKFLKHRKPSIERLLQGGKKSEQRVAVSEENLEEELGPMRDRAHSESSVLMSKYGSDNIEEMTAATFTINVEKYALRSRRDNMSASTENGNTSSDALLFPCASGFGQSSRPKVSKTAVQNLKSANELLGRSQDGSPVFSVDAEGSYLCDPMPSGFKTPNSLPSASPPTARRVSNTDTLRDFTKRLSLPHIYVSDDLAGQGQTVYHSYDAYKIHNANPFTAVKRRAYNLEPLSFEIEKKTRPHSMISVSGSGSASAGHGHAHESAWRRFIGSPHLSRVKAATAPRNLTKMFGRRREKSAGGGQGAISKLCLQALSVDPRASTLPARSPLPGTSHDESSPGTSEEHGKRKHRKHFLDAKWLAKPKKLFKSSKNDAHMSSSETSFSGEVDNK